MLKGYGNAEWFDFPLKRGVYKATFTIGILIRGKESNKSASPTDTMIKRKQ